MSHYITYIKDSIGNNYLGIKISNDVIQPYLNLLKEKIGDDDFNEYIENQKRRDNGEYHITVINVADYNKLSKEIGMYKFVNSLDNIFNYEIDDLKMIGLGTATKNENRSYFIVCESDKLDAVRCRYGLNSHDFHVTLGFSPRDVFGVRKNEVLK